MSIVGICGFLGAGKSTVADYLVHHHGYTRLSFASTVKDVVSSLFKWDRTLLEGATEESRDWRSRPDPFWSARLGREWTPRLALQIIGTEIGRTHIHENIWVDTVFAAIERLGPSARVVIDDARFPNELDAIRRAGGSILRVFRDFPSAEHERLWAVQGTPDVSSERIHSSEWSWLCWAPIVDTPCLQNTGTKEDFYVVIENWYRTSGPQTFTREVPVKTIPVQ